MEETATDVEKTFLNENGVTVTSTRFIVPSQTYAMSGITSVKSFTEHPSLGGPIILIVIGVLSFIMGKQTMAGGFVFLPGGIAWWYFQKAKHHVVLSSASGETNALTSTDKDWIGRVISALNNAIVHRG